MSGVLGIAEFLSRQKSIPIIDVRSPAEYAQGHIVDAYNIPLLDNEERAIVGTAYKQNGREEAVIKGFELVAHKFGEHIKNVRKIVSHNEILVYCWRGGMRSQVISWILNLAGFKTHILKDGYKNYRRWVLNILNQHKKIIVLGGMTGSGKTELLQYLSELGEQIINMEELAQHKGSAFGALGQQFQPTSEQFENKLAHQWDQISNNKTVWIEDESRMIGNIKIPDNIYKQMREASVVAIQLPKNLRIKRIISEYGDFPLSELIERTKKIKKRLGGQKLNQAVAYLESGILTQWVEIVLEYYDKAYLYGLAQRDPKSITEIVLPSTDYRQNAKKILELVSSKAITECN